MIPGAERPTRKEASKPRASGDDPEPMRDEMQLEW